MKICPKCGNVVFYNSYFGAYMCNTCDWEKRIDRNYSKKNSVFAIGTIKKLQCDSKKVKA